MDSRLSVTIFILLCYSVSAQDVLDFGDAKLPTLTFCVIMEDNTTGKVYDYHRSAAAIDLALDYVQFEILHQYHLLKVFRPLQDQCSLKTYVVAQAMDLMAKGTNCNVYIGPGCGMAAESLSDVAEFYDIPIIGVPAASMGLSAPADQYTVMTRVSFTYAVVAEAFMRFFSLQNYTTPTFLFDQSLNVFQQMGQLTEIIYMRKNFELYRRSNFFKMFYGNRSADSVIETFLRTGSLKSRIFVLYTDATSLRRVMLTARRLGMVNGEYLFIGVDLYTSPVWGTYTWSANDTYDADSRDSFRALLLLSLTRDARLRTNIFWAAVKKKAKDVYNYSFGDTEEVDLMLIHFFDAIFLYASVYVERTSRGQGVGGQEFADAITNHSFASPLSGNMTFNADGDKYSDFSLRSFSVTTGRHEVIYGLPASGPLIRYGILDWFGTASLPPNTPACGFDGKDVRCQNLSGLTGGQTAAAIIIPLLLLTAACVAISMVIRRLYFTEKDPFWWRIFLSEIEPSMTSYAFSAKSVANSMASGRSRTFTKSLDGDAKSMGKDGDGAGANKEVAIINGILSGVYELPEPKQRVPRELQGQLRQIRRLQHPNLQVILGVVVDDSNHCVYLAGELCGRGSMRALIADTKMELDWVFKNSLLKDLANGLNYLHSTKLISHGYLTDDCCLIDSRFVLKISMYGLGVLQNEDDLHPPNIGQTERNWRMLMYRAPELLRRHMPDHGTQKGDVYSYAILMQQIILRTDPFEMMSAAEAGKSARTQNIPEIVMEVKRGSTPPTRPTVRMNMCPAELHALMEDCWNEEPIDRPAFTRIRVQLLKILGRADDNIVDHLIHRMEVYAGELELEAETKMKQFMEERQRSQELLSNILPKTIAQALLRGQTILPETFPTTTVYFGDIHGFAEAVESLHNPVDILGLLNRLYGVYDEILGKYDVFQVEAVSDAYLVVSGLPIPNGIKHVAEISSMALDVRRVVRDMKTGSEAVKHFKLRVGINSGPCVAGVVGLQLPRYCLFGDTVNTSSRMESHGEAGKIHCSESSKLLLDKYPEYITVERGEVNIKGKGMMTTYWLIGKN